MFCGELLVIDRKVNNSTRRCRRSQILLRVLRAHRPQTTTDSAIPPHCAANGPGPRTHAQRRVSMAIRSHRGAWACQSHPSMARPIRTLWAVGTLLLAATIGHAAARLRYAGHVSYPTPCACLLSFVNRMSDIPIPSLPSLGWVWGNPRASPTPPPRRLPGQERRPNPQSRAHSGRH